MATLLRAYLRAVPGLSLADQRAMAIKDGISVRVHYEDTPKSFPQFRAEAIRSVRPNMKELLWVADLTVLVNDRKGLALLLADLDKRKVGIREGRTGRTSQAPHEGQAMAIEAMNRWSSVNKAFGDLSVTQAGSKGGKKAKRRRNKFRMPAEAVAEEWFAKRNQHMNTDQLVAHINAIGEEAGYTTPWSAPAIYRHKQLGARGAKAGPREKVR